MNLVYEEVLKRYRIKEELLCTRKSEITGQLNTFDNLRTDLLEARDVMSFVGIISQQEIKTIIEELVSQALQGIFGDNYSFELDDRISHNKPETEFYVVKNSKRRSMRDEQGGGVLDVVSIALRIVLWAVENPRRDNVIILDEPIRALHSKSMLESCGNMFKKLSEMLRLQFIIVSDINELLGAADIVYHVTQGSDEISRVERLNNESC